MKACFIQICSRVADMNMWQSVLWIVQILLWFDTFYGLVMSDCIDWMNYDQLEDTRPLFRSD